MKEMDSEVIERDSEVKEMADETRYLARLQAALELHDKAMAEKFFQDCAKEILKFAEVDDEKVDDGTCAFCFARNPCVILYR